MYILTFTFNILQNRQTLSMYFYFKINKYKQSDGFLLEYVNITYEFWLVICHNTLYVNHYLHVSFNNKWIKVNVIPNLMVYVFICEILTMLLYQLY